MTELSACRLKGDACSACMQKLEEEDIARTHVALEKLQEDSPSEGEDEGPQHALQHAPRQRRGSASGATSAGANNANKLAHKGAKDGGGKHGAASAPLLWVARHAPRSYLQLLSEEAVNASVLRWLKEWDPVVFGPPAGQEGGGAGQAGGLTRNCVHPHVPTHCAPLR